MPKNSLDNIELRSEEVQEILTNAPHWMIRWGNIIFLILILMLLSLSWFIKYPEIISSEAIVTTEIPPEKEFAMMSGKLDAILVSDNGSVTKDQPLAIVENTANYKDVFKLKKIVDTIRVHNKPFSFPIDSLPSLLLGDIGSTFAIFENNYIQYELNMKLNPFVNEELANRFSLYELNKRLSNLYSQQKIGRREFSFKEKDLKRIKLLYEKGVVSKREYEDKQVEYAQAEINYQNFESSISQLKEAINNANKTYKGTEINRVNEEMILLKNVIQSFDQLKKVIRDWEYMYVLKSNIEGTVSFLNVWSANQTVNKGDLVFSIIPKENSSFIAKLKTPSRNSGKIKMGQRVNVRLENYPETEFGLLNGIVKRISMIPDKEGNYFIDVELPEKLITSYNKEIEFKLEMRASADIITEDLRLIDRFFYQLRNVLKR